MIVTGARELIEFHSGINWWTKKGYSQRAIFHGGPCKVPGDISSPVQWNLLRS